MHQAVIAALALAFSAANNPASEPNEVVINYAADRLTPILQQDAYNFSEITAAGQNPQDLYHHFTIASDLTHLNNFLSEIRSEIPDNVTLQPGNNGNLQLYFLMSETPQPELCLNRTI